MKIAYLTNCYPAVSHTFIRREIEELERAGHQVVRLSIRPPRTILVDQRDQAEYDKTVCVLEAGFVALLLTTLVAILARPLAFKRAFSETLRMKRDSSRSWLRHAAYLAEACWLWRKFDWSSIDHLHVHFGTNAADVAVILHCFGGVPFSFTVHGPDEFDDPRGYNLPEKVSRARFVVAVSEFGRSQILRWLNLSLWTKIYVVHCTVDDRYQAVPAALPENRKLICVGRLSAQKGHGVLIEAAARLAEDGENFELILVGDGELRPDVERLINASNLTDRVQITGWVDGEAVIRLLSDSRALVLPSFAEGLPVVIMEAMALCRPVISTYIAGIPELVRPQENGWLVPAGDVESLVIAMREALNASSEKLMMMGEAGHRAVRINHNPRTEVSKLSMLFAGVEPRETHASWKNLCKNREPLWR